MRREIRDQALEQTREYILAKQRRKEALQSDPFYKFLVLVSGHTGMRLSALSRSLEETTSTSPGGSRGGGRSLIQMPPLTNPGATPAHSGQFYQPVLRTQNEDDTPSTNTYIPPQTEKSSGPAYPNDRRPRYHSVRGSTRTSELAAQLNLLSDSVDQQTRLAVIQKYYDDQQRLDAANWMQREDITGITDVDPVLIAAMASALRALQTRFPAQYPIDELGDDAKLLAEDPIVQADFAALVSELIMQQRIFKQTVQTLDKTANRQSVMLRGALQNMAVYLWDPAFGFVDKRRSVHGGGGRRPSADSVFRVNRAGNLMPNPL
jgi:hypothetical protein